MRTKSGNALKNPSAPPAARRALHLAWDSCLEASSSNRPPADSTFAADRLFHSLNGRTLFARGSQWLLHVYSVFDLAGDRWVQLELEGAGPLQLTMKMSPTENVKAIVASLSSWLNNPCATDRVIEVV